MMWCGLLRTPAPLPELRTRQDEEEYLRQKDVRFALSISGDVPGTALAVCHRAAWKPEFRHRHHS